MDSSTASIKDLDNTTGIENVYFFLRISVDVYLSMHMCIDIDVQFHVYIYVCLYVYMQYIVLLLVYILVYAVVRATESMKYRRFHTALDITFLARDPQHTLANNDFHCVSMHTLSSIRAPGRPAFQEIPVP